jgi:DNA-binding SARP family transcriptional activator/tetratricopeptide (TPR) repeat protein/TolB-like protein
MDLRREMPRLLALGSTFIAGPDGAPLAGAASQRRLLGLLTLLAVAGDEGLTRDRILGILWPDSEPERARHALTQTLYHARRALDADDLFITGGGTVRLNRARLGSDVADFEAALAARERERAVELYRAPFLDGFYLNGAASFEHWSSQHRDRYAHLATAALEELADEAEERGDAAALLRWCRRLVALDPLDSRRTVRLMEALAAAGDPAGALQQARLHAALLEQELEIAPAEEVLALEERLRAGKPVAPAIAVATLAAASASALGTISTPTPAYPGASRDVPIDGAEEPADADVSRFVEATPTETAHDASQRERAPRLRRVGIAAAIGAAVVASTWWLVERPSPAVAAVAPHSVVVAPFRVTGADPSLAFLQQGMIELLAVRLAGDSASRAVDPGPVLRAWRREGLMTSPDVSQAEVVRLAGSLGAERVVVGSVVGSAARVILSASLVSVPTGSVSAQATAEGPADSLTTLVDRLAGRLLLADAGEDDRLAAQTTPSLAALRAYLDAQAAFRRGDHLAALPLYETALARDSGFALAALQLALVADRVNDAEQHDRALALAWRAQHELSPRDRAHLVALAGPRYPEPSTEAEYRGAWERAAALSPDRADVWYDLGERFLYTGGALGVDGHAHAVAALRRALLLDPAYAASRELLILVAARNGDGAELARLASPAALRDSLGRLAGFVRWRVGVAREGAEARRRRYAELPRESDATLRTIAMASQYDGIAPEHGARALGIRELRATRVADRIDVLLAQHSQALNAGRPVQALDATERLEELRPGMRAHLRLRVLDALYGDGDAAAAAEAAGRIAVAIASAPATPVALADACVLEQWRLARGGSRGTRAVIERLRAGGADANLAHPVVVVGASPAACAALLEAQLAVVERRRDAGERVARFDSLMLAGPAIGDAGTYAHVVVARLHDALGDRPAALAAIRRRSWMSGWPRYLATARLLEARLARAEGDLAGCARVIDRYLVLRPAPEPTVAAQVDSARVVCR